MANVKITDLPLLTPVAAADLLEVVHSTSSWKAAASDIANTATNVRTVATGGTGAATLTGYVKGTGTTAMTASATIPVTDLTGTLTVAQGGTGAATLTGYVKGTGTTAMTASATIPVTDLTGTLTVAQGGTGVATLTSGYLVRGLGTSAVTASVIYDDGSNLGIGTSSPAAGTILDIQSTTKGVRFPNMTTTQKNAMTGAAGAVVFDTTLGKLCVYTGSAWQTITSA